MARKASKKRHRSKLSASSSPHFPMAISSQTPSGNELFFRQCAPIHRHYGGIVGSVSCGCTPSPANAEVAKTWRYNHRLTVPKLELPYHFLKHAQKVEEGEMSLLDCRGDWPTGVFLMQALAQSSYLQGKGECLSCAVRNAALAGCYQVIIFKPGPAGG